MSRSVILAYTKREDADKKAVAYSVDHKVMVIGPTDQVMFAREQNDGTVWRSGEADEFYLMIATKAEIDSPAGG